MISLVYILASVLCLAATATAALLGHANVTTYNTSFHRHYFYYLAAFYLFSIYGFWGQILVRVLLGALELPGGLTDTIASFVSMLGVPMLFVSWLMLVNIAHSLFDRTGSQAWLAVHAVVFLLLIAAALLALPAAPGAATAASPMVRIVVVLVGLEGLYFAAFLVLAHRSAAAGSPDRRRTGLRFCLLLAGAFVLRAALLPVAFFGTFGPLIVVGWFASNLLPLMYLQRVGDRLFAPVGAEPAAAVDLGLVLEPYGITKRERQIVEQICSGKTNQQIADTLFISLQTVKDHTHRIYGKLGIRNRIQLVNRINAGS